MVTITQIRNKLPDIERLVNDPSKQEELFPREELNNIIKELFSELDNYNEEAILFCVKYFCFEKKEFETVLQPNFSEISILLYLFTRNQITQDNYTLKSSYAKSFWINYKNRIDEDGYIDEDYYPDSLVSFLKYSIIPKKYISIDEEKTFLGYDDNNVVKVVTRPLIDETKIFIHSADQLIGFGKFREKRIGDIRLDYIFWCILNIPHFSIAYEFMEQIVVKVPSYIQHIAIRLAIYKNTCNLFYKMNWEEYRDSAQQVRDDCRDFLEDPDNFTGYSDYLME